VDEIMPLILASILLLIGVFLGFVAIVATDGALACIVSIAALTGSSLLIQEAQRPTVFPILRKAIRRYKQPQA